MALNGIDDCKYAADRSADGEAEYVGQSRISLGHYGLAEFEYSADESHDNRPSQNFGPVIFVEIQKLCRESECRGNAYRPDEQYYLFTSARHRIIVQRQPFHAFGQMSDHIGVKFQVGSAPFQVGHVDQQADCRQQYLYAI